MNLLAISGETFVTSLSPDLAIRWLGVRAEKTHLVPGSFVMILLAIHGETTITSLNPSFAILWLAVRKE